MSHDRGLSETGSLRVIHYNMNDFAVSCAAVDIMSLRRQGHIL